MNEILRKTQSDIWVRFETGTTSLWCNGEVGWAQKKQHADIVAVNGLWYAGLYVLCSCVLVSCFVVWCVVMNWWILLRYRTMWHVVSICWRYMLSRFAVLSFVVMVVLCCPCWVVVCCLVMDRFDRWWCVVLCCTLLCWLCCQRLRAQ